MKRGVGDDNSSYFTKGCLYSNQIGCPAQHHDEKIPTEKDPQIGCSNRPPGHDVIEPWRFKVVCGAQLPACCDVNSSHGDSSNEEEDEEEENSRVYKEITQSLSQEGPAEIFVHCVKHYGHEVSIKALRWQTTLFIYFTAEMIRNVSKECLRSVLEYGEEVYHCSVAFLVISQCTPAAPKWEFVHATRFMGFELLPPNHPMLPPVQCKDLLFLVYRIMDDED
eukprot:Em0010g231a